MPYRFAPVNPGTPLESAIAAFNNNFAQLDQESAVKSFNGASGEPSIITGELPYADGYGSLYYDPNGIPSIIIGVLPDGDIGIVAAKSGENVLDAFS